MSATDQSYAEGQLPCPDIQLKDVLITEELSRRSPRQPNLQAENQAMRSLARQLVHEPEQMLQSLVELALELCDAGTAGVSLIETQLNGEEVFHWVAMAGTLSAYVGGSTPRDACPCEICLERGVPVLFAHPERYFTLFQQIKTPLVESLVLPLIAEGQAIGTIWIVTHDEQRQFDAEDVRLMMGLADFTAANLLRSQQQANQLRAANTALAVEIGKRELAEDQILAVIENLPGGAVFVLDRNLCYQLAAGEALTITGIKSTDLVGKSIFEALPPELATSYESKYRQALEGQPFEHEHEAHNRYYISRGTPLRSATGEIYAVLAVSYDITQRKQVEAERERVEAALRESEAALSAELAGAKQLQYISSQLIQEDQIDALYEQILEAAIAIMGADMGSMQKFIPDQNELRLLAWRGFHPQAAEFWQVVDTTSAGSCSEALLRGERVIVPDVDTCEFMAGTDDLQAIRLSGIGAVQTTPLISRTGLLVGMISTHWHQPHHPADHELGLLDVLARQAADALERAQASQALRASEAEFRALVNLVPALLWQMDPTGKKVTWNTRWGTYTGQTLEQTHNNGWLEAIHPDDRPDTWQAYEQAYASQRGLAVQHRIRRFDGEYRWFLVHQLPIKDAAGAVSQWFGAAIDIHDQQVALEALRESEAKYRSLFNSMDEGFLIAEVIYDESGQPIDVLYLEGNPAATRMTGVENYAQRRLQDVSPHFESYWLKMYDRVARTGVSERSQKYAAPLGRWYDFYIFPISDTAHLNSDQRIAIIFQDVTERKRTEAALQASAARQSFLLELSDALRPLVNADDICFQAACILGQHLGAHRVGYAEAEAEETIVVTRNYTCGVPSIEGRYRYADYAPDVLSELQAGRTVARSDVANDPSLTAQEKAAHARLQLGATVNVPLLKVGRLFAVLFVHFQTAHTWSDGELALIAEVAERVWDAVERTRAEAALRESEENYRQLFTSIDEGFCTIEVLFDDAGQPCDHHILQANPSFERHSGVSHPVGKRVSELMPGLEPFWHDLYAQVIMTGQSVRQEIQSDTFDRWFEVLVSRIGEASRNQVAIVFTDITDRKQAEATITADLQDTRLLQELSARLTSEEDIQVFYNEIMAAAIALTRADAGTVQIFNETTQDLVLLATQGFDPAITEHFYRVKADSQTSCGLALKNGQRICIDFDDPEQADPDRSMQMHIHAGYLSAQSTPLITRRGRLIGMVSTHWHHHHRPTERELRFLDLLTRQAADLIEQRQAEVERKRLLEREQAARQEAEKANRIKDEFLAVLSHELRSPLNPILGWSKLLQSKPFDPDTTQRALATIERNAKLQTQLIDDLLDISRILRGKLNLEETPVNLVTVIEAAMEVVRTAAQAKSIELQFSLAQACQVRGDEGRLQQVVWNLLSNAIKFTPSGGWVEVRLQPVAAASAEGETPNTSTSPYSCAQITVTDSGQGISPEFMPYLFQSFRQEDASITRQYGGLGLGLAIVKYLVDAHGGSITAASPGIGEGATLTVQLPLLPQGSAPPLPPVSADIDLTGIKVLAVDDSEDTRGLLASVLNAYGAETHVFASGAEVLANLATFTPDVLICDIGMPDMDGYTLLQQIRALPNDQGGNTPAIAVTAFARPEDRQQALAYGFQQHLAKPIRPEELVSAIAQWAMR